MPIFGVPIETLRERAKSLVVDHFVSKAEADGTPPTLRALYVLKAAEARNVALGEHSSFVEREGSKRGLTMQQMAQIILHMSEASVDMELARVDVNLAIEAADSPEAISILLEQLGIQLSIEL